MEVASFLFFSLKNKKIERTAGNSSKKTEIKLLFFKYEIRRF